MAEIFSAGDPLLCNVSDEILTLQTKWVFQTKIDIVSFLVICFQFNAHFMVT